MGGGDFVLPRSEGFVCLVALHFPEMKNPNSEAFFEALAILLITIAMVLAIHLSNTGISILP